MPKLELSLSSPAPRTWPFFASNEFQVRNRPDPKSNSAALGQSESLVMIAPDDPKTNHLLAHGLESQCCECYAVVKNEYDRLLPARIST